MKLDRRLLTALISGLAIDQMTDEGLMASADISGTKYWKHDELHE